MLKSTGSAAKQNTMKTKPTTYSRFYALLGRMAGDREQIKEILVSRYSNGRTASLREMKAAEYEAMCDAMEAEIKHPGLTELEYKRELKRLRSAVLKRMQKIGIDTTSWDAVDTFCLQPRISGKKFAQLQLHELEVMIAKLEAIRRKNYSKRVALANELMVIMMRQPTAVS